MTVTTLLKNIYQNHFSHLLLFSLILLFAGILETTALVFLAPIFDNILNNDFESSSFLTKKIYTIFEYINFEISSEILFILFILSTALTALLQIMCVYFSEKIKFSYGRELMSETMKNLFSLKWSFFTKVKQGNLLNTLNREIQEVIKTIAVFSRAIANTVQFLIISILPFLISWKLVLIMIFTLLIVFAPLLILSKKAKKVGEKDTSANKNFLSSLQETFSGLKVILGNSLQKIVRIDLINKYSTLIKVAILRSILFNTLSIIVLPLMAIGFTILYYFSFSFLELKIVELTVVIAAFLRMNTKLGLIIREKAVLEATIASLKELNLINKIEKKFIIKQGFKNLDKFKLKIELKNVNYSYEKGDLILNRCNLLIPKGKIIGITGESGSGKSTLIDLIMGFDFPTKGNLEIDNTKIENINLENYRKKIGYVSQDIVLFNTSILKNILWTNANATKKDVKKIINKSKAFNFIKKLPNGLNTLVGDRGLSLSGGQIQRIALLRALIKNPEIIVLDECTSALDENNERYITDFLWKFKKSKTIIIVSHRLFSLKKTDFLYILDKGKIVEKGVYSKLKVNKKSILHKMLKYKKK